MDLKFILAFSADFSELVALFTSALIVFGIALIGRELRMIELKEEVESLKSELSRYKKAGGVQDD